MDHESIDGQDGFWLPFGNYLERDADLLILRRSDDSFVAAFSAEGVDLELAVWADARLALWAFPSRCAQCGVLTRGDR